MDNLNIAVVSPDEAYNSAFCMALLDACRQLSVTSYASQEFADQWAEGPEQDQSGKPHECGAFYDQYDLILWAGDEIRDSYGGNIVYLTEHESLAGIDHRHCRYALYKYSRADAIIASIFDIYSNLTGRQAMLVKRKNVKVLAFASCCGGVGCTSLTRAVSQELARFSRKRVMCLSLEEVESTADFLPLHEGRAPEGIRTEGEYLYRLFGKNTEPFLKPFLVKDDFGVCSFAPATGKNPLRDLSGEEMRRLLAALMDSGEFDVITVDVSTSLGEGAMTVLETAERICIAVKASGSGMREKHYLHQISCCCGEEISSRFVRAECPAGGFPQPQEALEGKFGQEIRKLTERLMVC